MDQVTEPKVPDGRRIEGSLSRLLRRTIAKSPPRSRHTSVMRTRSRAPAHSKQGSSHVEAASIRISSGQAYNVRARDAREGISASKRGCSSRTC